jgi:hypothetical protein
MKKQDKLPLYEVLIDENDDITGVDLISLVENPAIEVKGVAFSDQKGCGCGSKEEFVKPHKGEHQKEFIPRCISTVMNDGTTSDVKQAVAICYSIWDQAKMAEEKFVEPKSGETENEFISRCIPTLINDGTTSDVKQAAAICYTYWENKGKNAEMADDVPVVGGIKTHYNCKCAIENGRWVTHPELSESGVCEICLEAQKKWNRENSGKPGGGRFSAVREEQVVLGPAMIPDMKIYRVDEKTGDEYEVFFSAETIKKCRNKFAKKSGNLSININHTPEMAPAYIVESWLVEDPKTDKSAKYGYDLPVGTWMIAVKVEDPKFWEFVKAEDLTSFSIEGFLNYQLIQMGNLRRLSPSEIIDMMTENDLLDLI